MLVGYLFVVISDREPANTPGRATTGKREFGKISRGSIRSGRKT
jgi:hypothetical protein